MKPLINERRPQGIRQEGKDFRISKLGPDAEVFGSKTKGEFFVQCFEDGQEMSGSFWCTYDEAILEVEDFMGVANEHSWSFKNG